MSDFDIVLVGGGLQNGLIALAVLSRRPDSRVAMVEAGSTLGGNHTWCVHSEDVPPAALSWMEPLVSYRWPGCDVRFPGLSRTVFGPYCAITSARFAAIVGAAMARSPRSTCYLGRLATRLAEREVQLDDGTCLRAPLVVDARGPSVEGLTRCCGFQKFLGLEIELDRPHGLARPVLMDATLPQPDGFRFFYILPFGPRRLLVEDTCFSRSPELDVDSTRAEVFAYARRFGRLGAVLREEGGVLPMPWRNTSMPPDRSPLVAGYRGGWFHPGTGYSLPAAVRLACHVAERAQGEVLGPELQRLYRRHRRQASFAESLNRLAFTCFEPKDMWKVFERFFSLPDGVVHRFFSMSTTWADRTRILWGPPPPGFSLSLALAAAGTR